MSQPVYKRSRHKKLRVVANRANSPEIAARWSQVAWCRNAAAQFRLTSRKLAAGARCWGGCFQLTSAAAHRMRSLADTTASGDRVAPTLPPPPRALTRPLKLCVHWSQPRCPPAARRAQLRASSPPLAPHADIFLHAHAYTHIHKHTLECTRDVIRSYSQRYIHLRGEINK